ncbi:MAG: hypothetical protein ACMXYD_01685 [Candidatus Woesearchaeota archaeon]
MKAFFKLLHTKKPFTNKFNITLEKEKQLLLKELSEIKNIEELFIAGVEELLENPNIRQFRYVLKQIDKYHNESREGGKGVEYHRVYGIFDLLEVVNEAATVFYDNDTLHIERALLVELLEDINQISINKKSLFEELHELVNNWNGNANNKEVKYFLEEHSNTIKSILFALDEEVIKLIEFINSRKKLVSKIHKKVDDIMQRVSKTKKFVKLDRYGNGSGDYCYSLDFSLKELQEDIPLVVLGVDKELLFKRGINTLLLHTDDLEIPHVNYQFEKKPHKENDYYNIHLVPEEKTEDFEKWVNKYKVAS